MGFFSNLRPFRVVAECFPCSGSLIRIFESDQISELMIALPNVGSPVTYVLDAVLFEQLGRVVGESGIDSG